MVDLNESSQRQLTVIFAQTRTWHLNASCTTDTICIHMTIGAKIRIDKGYCTKCYSIIHVTVDESNFPITVTGARVNSTRKSTLLKYTLLFTCFCFANFHRKNSLSQHLLRRICLRTFRFSLFHSC